MDDFDSTVSTTAAGIEAEFDGRWGAWLSDTGQWWAARRQALSAEDLAAGCVPYLQANSPDDLRERIRDEEALTMRHNARRERQLRMDQPGKDQIPEDTDRLWKPCVNGISASRLYWPRKQAGEAHARRDG
jgi:hypothetical protein